MLTGIVLILGALGLFGYNQMENHRAAVASQDALDKVKLQIPDTSLSQPPILPGVGGEMPTTVVDGETYIGILQIPTLNLELPVMGTWNYAKLFTAPCRQFGTVDGNDLVIAAHNYRGHFGTIPTLKNGDTVLLTDANGAITVYKVGSIFVVNPTDVDSVKHSGWDLLLYTCNFSGAQRICVGCTRSTVMQATGSLK